MLSQKMVYNSEQKALELFFQTSFSNIPIMPDWIDDELLNYWKENLFHVHYLPSISLDRNLDLPFWKYRPSKCFYKKIESGELKQNSSQLNGQWILIDSRNRPKQKVPWIRIQDTAIFEKFGFKPKEYFKKWTKQKHNQEFLGDILKEKGFGSRFCHNLDDIKEYRPFIRDFLRLESDSIIRLPRYIEYNYLGNAFYPKWNDSNTWEWFADELNDGYHLAGGCDSVGSLGWDPPYFWSTVLAFRPFIEL